ncbi:MAG: 4Fe-4S dicluster domain-containing protein [Firmicutes bacterium]|nr:4Fe-4S dicluster domain-containing protein [Bacillota bacterium]
MKTVVLPRENLEPFLGRIARGHDLIVPKKTGNDVVFDYYQEGCQIALEYRRTLLPPKKFFLPPEEVLFRYKKGQGFTEPEPEVGRRVFFGLHPCDIHALKRLDYVFLEGYVDTYYRRRRERTLIIGLSCLPDDKCFCHSMGTDLVSDGFDLFFTDLGEVYLVEVGSTSGNDLVLTHRDLVSEVVDEAILKEYKTFISTRSDLFVQTLDTSGLSKILTLEWESPFWEKVAQDCLACGRCSMSCPTCYCFSIYDQVNLDSISGERSRSWTSCLYKDYALVAGGHNFRPSRGARLRQRLMHKHKDFFEQQGVSACVGCGRCQANCPAGIDFCQVLTSLRGDISESAVG